jgi:kynurenine formamidase
LTGAVFVDLSHPIHHGMITYPGLPGPVFRDHLSREASRERYAPGYEFQIGHIEMVANTGTYLDTPFHRFADGHDLAGLDLARVAGVPGLLVGVNDPEAGPIGPQRLEGVDVAGRAVLFHTGWDRHWGTDRYGEPDHPYLADETADLLVAGGVAVVGIDAVNIDGTADAARPIHTILLGAGVPIVEHLTGLGRLAGTRFTFSAVPPAVVGVGTFPVRAFAVVDP